MRVQTFHPVLLKNWANVVATFDILEPPPKKKPLNKGRAAQSLLHVLRFGIVHVFVCTGQAYVCVRGLSARVCSRAENFQSVDSCAPDVLRRGTCESHLLSLRTVDIGSGPIRHPRPLEPLTSRLAVLINQSDAKNTHTYTYRLGVQGVWVPHSLICIPRLS